MLLGHCYEVSHRGTETQRTTEERMMSYESKCKSSQKKSAMPQQQSCKSCKSCQSCQKISNANPVKKNQQCPPRLCVFARAKQSNAIQTNPHAFPCVQRLAGYLLSRKSKPSLARCDNPAARHSLRSGDGRDTLWQAASRQEASGQAS